MLRGNILTPNGWIRGTLSFEAGRIAALDGAPVDPGAPDVPRIPGIPGIADASGIHDIPGQPGSSPPPAGLAGFAGSTGSANPAATAPGAPGNPATPDDSDTPYILPGFIDLHVHGGGGADVMDIGDDPADAGVTAPHAARTTLATLTRTHAQHGTTSLLATTMTAPRAQLARVLARLGESAQTRAPGGARVLGVHLEGPYLNPGKLGAQPDAAVPAALDEVLDYLRLAPVRVVTIAPEIAGHLAIIAALTARGIRVQLGHSLATYEETVAALAQGACGFTHLFNAMPPLHHRQPGMVGAALAHAQYAELIPDLLHVHPGALRAALRAITHAYVVTDSTAAAGMPDGAYRLGSQRVHKCLGGVRLADGTLAGSALTMDAALRNLVALGLTLADASHRLSRHAADYLGLNERGRLAPGAWADCVVLDRHLALKAVYVEGEAVAVKTGSGQLQPKSG